ncbi:MAG: hypothetical protein ACH349_07415 [Candidatus Rhabdochlamydia sp.]
MIPAMAQKIVSVVAAFATSFTRPTWKKIQALLIGAILCRGARRITSILRVMDLREEKNYSKFTSTFSFSFTFFSYKRRFVIIQYEICGINARESTKNEADLATSELWIKSRGDE